MSVLLLSFIACNRGRASKVESEETQDLTDFWILDGCVAKEDDIFCPPFHLGGGGGNKPLFYGTSWKNWVKA